MNVIVIALQEYDFFLKAHSFIKTYQFEIEHKISCNIITFNF